MAAAPLASLWPLSAAPARWRTVCALDFSQTPLPVSALYSKTPDGIVTEERSIALHQDDSGRAYGRIAGTLGYDFNHTAGLIGFAEVGKDNFVYELQYWLPWLRGPETGTLLLNLLAIFRSLSQGSSRFAGLIPDYLDLRGARIELNLMPVGLRLAKDVELCWLVQSSDPGLNGRSNNMIQVRDPVCRLLGARRVAQRSGPVTLNSSEPVKISIPLVDDDDAWLMLGARGDRTDIYAKSKSAAAALRSDSRIIDMALVAASPTMPNRSETMVSGELRLYGCHPQ